MGLWSIDLLSEWAKAGWNTLSLWRWGSPACTCLLFQVSDKHWLDLLIIACQKQCGKISCKVKHSPVRKCQIQGWHSILSLPPFRKCFAVQFFFQAQCPKARTLASTSACDGYDAPGTQQLFASLFSPHCSVCGLTPHFLHAAHAWLRGRIINFLMSFSTLPVTTESEGWTNRTELNLLLASLRRRGWCSPHLTDAGDQEIRKKK